MCARARARACVDRCVSSSAVLDEQEREKSVPLSNHPKSGYTYIDVHIRARARARTHTHTYTHTHAHARTHTLNSLASCRSAIAFYNLEYNFSLRDLSV